MKQNDNPFDEWAKPGYLCRDCKHIRAHQAGIAQSEAAPMHMVYALTCLRAEPFRCSDRKRMLETARPMTDPCPGFTPKP